MNKVCPRIEAFSRGFLALEEAMRVLRSAVLLGSAEEQTSAYQSFLEAQRLFTETCEGDEIISGAFLGSEVESGVHQVVEKL